MDDAERDFIEIVDDENDATRLRSRDGQSHAADAAAFSAAVFSAAAFSTAVAVFVSPR